MIRVMANSTFQAPFLFEISDEDITAYLNEVGTAKHKIKAGDLSELEGVLKDVAAWLVQTGRARQLGFDRSSFQVQVDQEQLGKIRTMFNMTEGQEGMNPQSSHHVPGFNSIKVEAEGNKNPAQSMANEALKIAKALSDLLNTIAQMQNREEIAQVAGLSDLPERIQSMYEYADRLRQGNVMDLQQPQATYAGWDIEKIIKEAAPFVDSKTSPIEVVTDPMEEFRFPTEMGSCGRCGDVKQACACGNAK